MVLNRALHNLAFVRADVRSGTQTLLAAAVPGITPSIPYVAHGVELDLKWAQDGASEAAEGKYYALNLHSRLKSLVTRNVDRFMRVINENPLCFQVIPLHVCLLWACAHTCVCEQKKA